MEQPIPIIFENEQLVVIDKPAGISFHSEHEAGIVVLTAAQLGQQLYSVHRLDKMTSGLLILAKDPKTAHHLTTLFEAREIEKYYLAISLRKPKKKQGWVKGDMASSRRGSYKLLATTENPAITRFISASLRPNERLFLVKPYTGKTHQIRVALKSLGAPIAGDERYANADEARLEERGYLHAYALRFELDGKVYRFVSPPHEGERFCSGVFKTQLQEWHAPWDLF